MAAACCWLIYDDTLDTLVRFGVTAKQNVYFGGGVTILFWFLAARPLDADYHRRQPQTRQYIIAIYYILVTTIQIIFCSRIYSIQYHSPINALALCNNNRSSQSYLFYIYVSYLQCQSVSLYPPIPSHLSLMQNNPSLDLNLLKNQVSGKAPKLVSADNRIVLKCYTHEEYLFYEYFKNQMHVGKPQYSLLKFMPKYYGLMVLESKPNINREADDNKQINIWLEHVKDRYDAKNQGNKFILMSNFLQGYSHPNIFDIKVGGRQSKVKKNTFSVAKYKLKLNGLLKTNMAGEAEFISKYILNPVCQFPDLCTYVAYFFKSDGRLRTDLIEYVVDKLKDLVLALSTVREWKLDSTSICIVYNSGGEDLVGSKIQVKYIDFGRAVKRDMADEGTYDKQTALGIQNMITFMQHILDNRKCYEKVQVKQSEQEVVPRAKAAKFSSRDANNQDKAL